MRRLSPDEAALWQRVTGTVRRTQAGRVRGVDVGSRAAEKQESAPTIKPKQIQHLVAPRSTAPVQPANTLDGSWDKRIAGGRIVPERTIDLHGLNLVGAHARLEHGLATAVRDGVRVVLLVTGRPARQGASRIDMPLRGIIRESVGDWLASSRSSHTIAAVRNAHPRHGGAGALYIVLRRAK
jgi:DNA-nicking Smr family endonuclease